VNPSQPQTIDRQRTTLTNRKPQEKEYSTPHNIPMDLSKSKGDAFQVDREHSG
jgi:hypothetical protein